MDSIALFFTYNDSIGGAELDTWRQGLAGFQMVGGETLKSGYGKRFSLENDRTYELLVETRPGVVRMSVDGELLHEMEIDSETFFHPTLEWNWHPHDRPAALAMGSWESSTWFQRVEWRAVELE